MTKNGNNAICDDCGRTVYQKGKKAQESDEYTALGYLALIGITAALLRISMKNSTQYHLENNTRKKSSKAVVIVSAVLTLIFIICIILFVHYVNELFVIF